MSKEEIIVGLNNAVSRGESLEKATQSMIMAGYNTAEVQEAKESINMGVIGNLPQEKQTLPAVQPLPANEVSENMEKPKKKKSLVFILLLILILILVLGLIAFAFYGEGILNALFPKA